MNQTTTAEFISLRKGLLQAEISKAKLLEDLYQLSSLKAKWVHRFGLNSLDEIDFQTLGAIGEEPIEKLILEGDLIQGDKEVEETRPLEGDLIQGDKEVEETRPLEVSSTLARQELDSETTQSQLDLAKETIGNFPKQETNKNIDHSLLELERDIVNAPPPPSPSISHFRRWLTSFDESSRKAS